MKLFNIDSPIIAFLNRMADLLILNLLFLLCCLPIVTIGASVTALYSQTLKMVHNHESYIARSFFKAWRENVKQSTIMWIISLVVTFFMFADIRIFSSDSATSYRFLMVGAFFILIVVMVIQLYFYPLLSRFENTFQQTIKNSLLMAFRHLPWTACLILISFGPLIGTLFVPPQYGFVYLLWILFGFSLIAYCNSCIFEGKIFCHYIPNKTVDNDN